MKLNCLKRICIFPILRLDIHTIAKILAKDLHAVENKEMVYKQLKLAPADLIPLKLKFAAEHNVYNFFSDTLQKWHGGLGTSATVELFLDELKNMDISELEGCIRLSLTHLTRSLHCSYD
jgi:hypothetical protein